MINKTQNKLEEIYSISAGLPASDLLIEHDELKALLGETHPFTYSEEVVLACSSSGELEVGIFFDKSILENLENLNQHQSLTLMEGISHYLLFVHKHQNDLEVSQLELEMQAQIDKFLLLVLDENKALSPDQALKVLDQSPNLKSLDQKLIDLYQESNQLALTYCHHLAEDYLKQGDIQALFAKVRDFYRQSSEEKLRQAAFV